MSWVAFLENRQAVLGPYGTEEPVPDPVSIRQINLDSEGPSLYVSLDLPSYPVHPPQKWQGKGFNRVQVAIGFVGISDISISGWSTNVVGNLRMARNPDGRLRIQLSAVGFEMTLTAMTAFVQKVSGYCDGAVDGASVQAQRPAPPSDSK